MVYLDNAAGTRPYPEVLSTIGSVIEDHYGNASADNSLGHDARMIIENVTNQVAMDIHCNPDEIIWTSGACEANSLAIIGTLDANDMIFCTTNLEHTSTIEAMYDCNSHVKYLLKNDNYGNIDISYLEQTLSEVSNRYGKPFVSISYANSEIGVIQDVKTIASIVHKYNGLLHVDATQMYPWHHIDVKNLGIDLMSVSGQKMHCVKGIGFLYVRNGIRIRPLIYGSQQDGRRGGTYPTHLIAAFGTALKITRENNYYYGDTWHLRNELLSRLLKIEGAHLNGPAVTANRLPNNISLTIDGVSADRLTTLCDIMGVIIAKGSACKSYEPKPSQALLAIGLTEEQALNTVRISLGMLNSSAEVEYAADIITNMVRRIREDE